MGTIGRRERVEAALREHLDLTHLELVDESHLHAGHAGAASGGGHFRALVVSPGFAGRGRIERQRLVHAALADAMGREIHALSFRTLTPEEWRAEATP